MLTPEEELMAKSGCDDPDVTALDYAGDDAGADDEARARALDALEVAWCRLYAEIQILMGREPN